jgi:hypothetical protein
MSDTWESLFPLTTVHKLNREISDHNPIILDTMENKPKKKNVFRFEKSWIKEEGFLERVDRAWNQRVRANSNLDRLLEKAEECEEQLERLGL